MDPPARPDRISGLGTAVLGAKISLSRVSLGDGLLHPLVLSLELLQPHRLVNSEPAVLAAPFVEALLRNPKPRQILPTVSPCAIRTSASRSAAMISSVDLPFSAMSLVSIRELGNSRFRNLTLGSFQESRAAEGALHPVAQMVNVPFMQPFAGNAPFRFSIEVPILDDTNLSRQFPGAVCVGVFMFLRSLVSVLALLPSFGALAQSAPPAWTGFYSGLSAGHLAGGTATHTGDGGAASILLETAHRQVVGLPLPASYPDRSQDRIASGHTIGGQLGFNVRLMERVVGGGEIDFQWADGSGERSITGPINNLNLQTTLQSRMALDRFGTARLRLGFLATNQLLLYGTGGLAFGNLTGSSSLSIPLTGVPSIVGAPPTLVTCTTSPCMAGASSEFRTGWTAGFGAEWAFAQNLSIKFEYLRVDLGEQTFKVLPTAAAPPPLAPNTAFATTRLSDTFDVVRLGLNYRLGN